MDQARLGRYELIAQLATGGMGRVSLGKSTGEGGFERHVVIKSLDAVDVDDAEATAMFLDEARILGMLHHQHVAAIQEVGRDEAGRLFLVLEYVHGHSAHDVWERAQDLEVHLPLDFTLTIIAAAASGLHYAHTKRSPDGERLNIVHRDVTLSNLMLGFDGTVKVIDFGIAKAALRETKTKSGFIKGKLGYMAPEQLRGQHLDARTDVFALGIVLYELTTMRRAFREKSDRGTVERIKAGRYTRPSEIVPDYPPGLEAIVMKALRVDPAQRYADADEMRIAVEGLGHELRLVVGDAAVVDTMMRLFPNRAEPWQRRATTRAETESAIEVEWEDPHIGITREAPPGALEVLLADRNTPPARPITEAAEELVVDSQVTTRISTNPAEAGPTLQPRGQHHEQVETTGEMIAPPTFLEPVGRLEPDPDDADLGAVISSLDLDPKTAPTAVPLPDEPRPPPAEPAPPVEAKPRAGGDQQHQKTAFIRAQKPPSRSPVWLFVGTLIVAVSIAAAVLLYLYEQKQQAANKPAVTEPSPTPDEPTPPDSVGSSAGAKTAPMPPFPAGPAPDAGAGSGSSAPPPDAGADSAVAPGAIHLRITSTPSDATVLLDGERLGHTPFEGDRVLAPGEHVLKIRLRGYAAQKRTIQVADQAVDEAFTLLRERN